MPLLALRGNNWILYACRDHRNQRAALAGDVCSAKESFIEAAVPGHVEPLAISRWCLNRDFQ